MAENLFRVFARDETGGATIMGLFWFMVLAAFAGLAIDSTNGFRNKTMLQATADAAALAAAIDLPDKSQAVNTASTYAADNMAPSVDGTVLDPKDVLIGKWDESTRSLDQSAPNPDAVMVTVWRGAANGNAVAVNFLRIIGLQSWNVRAQAVAQKYIPDCLRDGLISRLMVNMSSNNHFTNNICIHGQTGVDIQSNNIFDPGVNVSMLHLDTLQLPASGFSTNTGLKDALRENGLDPRMVNHVEEIIDGVLNLDPKYTPGFVDTTQPVLQIQPTNFSSLSPHRVYYVQCKSNQNLVIPANSVIQHVALIADCQITIGANAQIMDSFIASRSGGTTGSGTLNRGDANITAAAGTQLGTPDNCAPGGGTQLFSNATITTSSTTAIDGVQMVAAGEIELGARDQGINGISAQAGGNINLTSNNMFGLCQGGVPDLFTSWYYRLVL